MVPFLFDEFVTRQFGASLIASWPPSKIKDPGGPSLNGGEPSAHGRAPRAKPATPPSPARPQQSGSNCTAQEFFFLIRGKTSFDGSPSICFWNVDCVAIRCACRLLLGPFALLSLHIPKKEPPYLRFAHAGQRIFNSWWDGGNVGNGEFLRTSGGKPGATGVCRAQWLRNLHTKVCQLSQEWGQHGSR